MPFAATMPSDGGPSSCFRHERSCRMSSSSACHQLTLDLARAVQSRRARHLHRRDDRPIAGQIAAQCIAPARAHQPRSRTVAIRGGAADDGPAALWHLPDRWPSCFQLWARRSATARSCPHPSPRVCPGCSLVPVSSPDPTRVKALPYPRAWHSDATARSSYDRCMIH